jgi:hypothetical protein
MKPKKMPHFPGKVQVSNSGTVKEYFVFQSRGDEPSDVDSGWTIFGPETADKKGAIKKWNKMVDKFLGEKA